MWNALAYSGMSIGLLAIAAFGANMKGDAIVDIVTNHSVTMSAGGAADAKANFGGKVNGMAETSTSGDTKASAAHLAAETANVQTDGTADVHGSATVTTPTITIPDIALRITSDTGLTVDSKTTALTSAATGAAVTGTIGGNVNSALTVNAGTNPTTVKVAGAGNGSTDTNLVALVDHVSGSVSRTADATTSVSGSVNGLLH